MAQAASSSLSIGITREHTEYITRDESETIQDFILKQIISEATKQDEEDRKTVGPIFNRMPKFEDGALKMWCENDETLAWLKHIVSTCDQSLVVKSQSEIQKRHTCKFQIIYDNFIDSTNIGSLLSYQNPWVDFKRWEIVSANKLTSTIAFQMSIPEDQVLHLMKAERCLSIGLTTVLTRFLVCGNWKDVPQDWDLETKQFLIED